MEAEYVGHAYAVALQLTVSQIQEIPMPADGNVIFIVEEGVTLDVSQGIAQGDDSV